MKTVNETEFREEVLLSQDPVLVDFFATWCGPCRMMQPALEAVATKAKVVKVDVDRSSQLAAAYRIEAMPTCLVFRGGREVKRIVGLQNERQLLAALGM